MPPLRRTERGRWMMIAVLLVCAAPVVASYFAYFVMRPAGAHQLQRADRAAAADAGLAAARRPRRPRGRAARRCAASGCSSSSPAAPAMPRCERHLWLQRQLHETLGAREGSRRQGLADRRRQRRRGARRWRDRRDHRRAPRSRRRPCCAPTARPWANGSRRRRASALEDHLYLVDPRGDWMMRVPVDAGAGAAEARPRQAAARVGRLGPAGR